MKSKNSPLITVFELIKYTWSYLVKRLRLKTVLNQLAHHDHNLSVDLEIETIKRLRTLVPLLSPQCRVGRELKKNEPVLCLDFTNCPQDLNRNKKEWQEFALLLALSCHYLGLAHSVVFKNGGQIIGWMSLEQIA